MSAKHPYTSSKGPVIKAVQHFRSSLPSVIDASTIKKLGLAPNNESYVINVLRFLEVIDDTGSPTPTARKVFNIHEDGAFAAGFANMVQSAYKQLFDLHADASWTLEHDKLVTFFRQTDSTSSIVGTRQAVTFAALAYLSGKRDEPAKISKGVASQPRSQRTEKRLERQPQKERPLRGQTESARLSQPDYGLTVRIEVNLPGSGDQETYDRIFRSIRENLLNAK